mmetsp:Transcript_6209/g.19879  ORF Transcript_6209/g.19879 Transcript_6209/m.19879 type:complete len:102 (-) Transcript_6209:301-606(-)
MAEDTSAQDYVRVKRRNTIIFLYVQLSDTASDLRQKLSAISKVDAAEMKLFLDKNGDVPLDEKKSLADQKVENDQEIFLVYRTEDGSSWEPVEVGVPEEGA